MHNYFGTGKKEKYIKTVILPFPPLPFPPPKWEEDSFLEDSFGVLLFYIILHCTYKIRFLYTVLYCPCFNSEGTDFSKQYVLFPQICNPSQLKFTGLDPFSQNLPDQH